MGRKKKQPDHKREAEWSRKESLIHRLIREELYDLSEHAKDKISENYWNLDDVENALLTGVIDNVENDDNGSAVDGKKYTLVGRSCDGVLIQTVGKIMMDEDGQYYFVITAY